MKSIYIVLTGAALVISACTTTLETMTRSDAIVLCQGKASDASGPTYGATVGANSNTGFFGGLSISLSDAYIRGLDPAAVFEHCMNELAANGQIVEG